MPTVIDSLIVTLGLDPAGFTKGQKQTAEALVKTKAAAADTAKSIEARGKQIAEGFNLVRNSALAMLGVFTAGQGIVAFTQNTISGTAALGRMARVIGMSTSELATWQEAAKRSGGSAEGMAGALRGLSQDIEGFSLTGQSSAIPVLNQLGIQLGDGARRMRPMSDVFMDLADAMKRMADAGQIGRANAIGNMLGLDPGTINMLTQGSGALRRTLDAARARGVPSDVDATASVRLENAWLDFSQRMTTTGRRALIALAPVLERVLGALERLGAYLESEAFQPIIAAFGARLKELSDYLGEGSFRRDFDAFAKGIREMTEALLETLRFLGIISRPEQYGPPRPSHEMDPTTGLPRGLSDPLGLMGGAPPVSAASNRTPRVPPSQALDLILGEVQQRYPGARVVSGFRSPEQNAAAGGAHDSQHLHGRAIDLDLSRMTPADRERLVRELTSGRGAFAGVGGIGTYNREGTSLHIDTRPSGRAAWGPSRGADSLNQTPDYFQDAVRGWQQSRVDPGLMRGATPAAYRNGRGAAGNSTTETTIGTITINTQATDAAGIARDLRTELGRWAFVPQVNVGLA